MARSTFVATTRRRLLGVLYIVVVAGLVALSIAFYQKTFTSTVDVTLKADYTGNSLLTESDVKLRGIIVGSVKSINVEHGDACTQGEANTTDCVSVTLALDPGRVKIIPANVSAQILPKTLFGEQYVSLSIPDDPSAHIRAGDVITQDRTRGALETQRVIANLYPLLTAVSPADLNTTLTAVADALSGNGDRLGQTLSNLDAYLKEFNRAVDPSGRSYTQKFVDDLVQLGKVADLYRSQTGNIVGLLKNLQVSARTLINRQEPFDLLLRMGSSTSQVLSGFLQDNRSRLISIVGSSDKIYGVLDTYSPEFTCLFAGLNKVQQLANGAVHGNAFHLGGTLYVPPKGLGKYVPGNEPSIVTGYGPNCFSLPNPPKPYKIPGKYRCINDGAALTDDPCAQSRTQSVSGSDQQQVGSAAETAYINSLIAGEYGTAPQQVPAVATLLAGPMLRGQTVAVK